MQLAQVNATKMLNLTVIQLYSVVEYSLARTVQFVKFSYDIPCEYGETMCKDELAAPAL